MCRLQSDRSRFEKRVASEAANARDAAPGIRVPASLTTTFRSFIALLVDYTLGNGFSPLPWLEYGEPASAGHVWQYPLLAPLALAAALVIVAIALRRLPALVRRKDRRDATRC